MDFAVPTCLKGKPCKLVCCSVNCLKAPYVCRSEGCPCDSPHQHCKHVNWNTLLHDLRSKLPSRVDPILSAVRKFLTDAIADLQAQLNNFETYIENIIGLTQNEQDFLRVLKTKKHEMLNGSFIYSLEKDLSVPVTGLPIRSREDLELELTLWKKQLKTLLSTIKVSYDKEPRSNKRQNDDRSIMSRSPLRSMINEPTFGPFQSPPKQSQSVIESISLQQSRTNTSKPSRFREQNQALPYFNLDSKLTNDTKTLMSFFSPRGVKTFQLLFRASQHKFSAFSFHQFCDLIPNTLTIAKTEYGEVIGGFTPLKWDATRDGNYEYDNTGSSFLFSLSRKEKMRLVEPSRAIANDSKFGPVFGSGHDFAISDGADKYAHSSSEFPSSYSNSHPQETTRSLSGAKHGAHFKIIEWEVYEVLFG